MALKKEQELKVKLKGRKAVLVSLVAKEDVKGLLYTKLKREAAGRIGLVFQQEIFSLADSRGAIELMREIRKEPLAGLIVQKPGQELGRKYFKTKEDFKAWWLAMTDLIPEGVDVDALKPQTLGKIVIGKSKYYPATVMAVWQVLLMAFKEKELMGKTVVILGSSEILGKPLALLLRDKGMAVILLGSGCCQADRLMKEADVVIGAAGYPKIITEEKVKPGAVVIDAAGGDVDFTNVKKKASLITPPTGGIGPLTVVNLLANLVENLQ